MSDADGPTERNVEEEEPMDGQLVFKGPEWLRRLIHGDVRKKSK